MKLKSFLFLVAALAVGLAFASCGGDAEIEYRDRDVNKGYASQIAAINAAFTDGASTVKLVGETKFLDGDEPLVIPANKTLVLDGYTLNDDANASIIAVEGSIDFSKGGNVILTGESYFLAPSAFISGEGNVGTATTSKVVVGDTGSASVVGTQAVSGAVVSFTGSSLPASTDGRYAALAAGSTGIILFGPSLTTHIEVGEKPLYVRGDLGLSHAGTITNGGTLFVTGVVNNTVTAAGTTVVSGELKAKSLKSTGGLFAGTVTLTGVNASNELAGSFAGGLDSSGAATLKGDVYFALPSTILGPVTVNDKDINLWGEGGLTVNGATVGKKLAIGGTLTTTGNVTLTGNTGSIVLGANGGIGFTGTGKLTGTDYSVSGDGGSLLNTAEVAGTNVTFVASGITTDFTNQADYTPNIVFGGAANLVYTASATISGYNLDVENGGTISLTGNSLTLTITGGGSITAKGDPAGTLAAGKLYIVTNSVGSLVAGTLYAGEQILAGSYGTFAAETNFIYSDVTPDLAGTLASYGQTNSSTGINDTTGGQAITDKMLAVFDDTAVAK
jgi:hypothetical protein